jgi:hypothetical protein
MPEHLRGELASEDFGTLLQGNPSENASCVMKIIASKKPPKVIAVGDVTLKALLEAGCIPDLGIFDRQTKRLPCEFPKVETKTVKNPAGEITDEAVSSIKKALFARRMQRVMLVVEGEEDLLALAAITQAPNGSLVIYGMPNRGMVVATADSETKEKVAFVISQFQRKG